MILEKLRQNRKQVREMGVVAVEAASRAGAPAYYRARGRSGAIVREMPDGRRQIVVIDAGQEAVVRTLKPRKR